MWFGIQELKEDEAVECRGYEIPMTNYSSVAGVITLAHLMQRARELL